MRTRTLWLFALVSALLFAPAIAARADDEGHSREPCDDPELGPGAECGTFRVFENRARAEGRTIDLAYLRLPQTGNTPAAEPLLLLAGGPGQSARGLLSLAQRPFAELRELRDIVLVDLRGTGSSNPLDCDTPGAEERPQAVFGNLFDPEVIAACAERLRPKADLTLYDTAHSVDDLDDLVRWLGYDRVVLWGASGGTRTALVYMQRHPDAVAAAVLDSPAPLSLTAPLDYAHNSQRALDKLFEACRAEPACRARYPELSARFASLVERLRRGPVATTFTEPGRDGATGRSLTVDLHLGDFGYAVRGLLYRGDAKERLPRMIERAAESGDLGEFALAYWLRNRGLEPAIQEGLHLSTLCAEDTWRIANAEVPRATADTFLGDYLVRQYRDACAVWDVGAPPKSLYTPVTADLPVLVLSGDLDPTTPPRYGRDAARHLPRGVHLTVADASHGVSFHPCTRPLVLDFLTTLELPATDPTCTVQGGLAMAPDGDAE